MKDLSGKLIIIESSTDGAGKQTQTNLLKERLENSGYKVFSMSFPNYDADSSYFVKKYLNGEFGLDPKTQNPYLVSLFFAQDRAITYQNTIKGYIEKGYVVLLDRYTTSNMVYQASKIKDPVEKEEFLDWLYDLEFEKLGLLKPDFVIFLDMKLEVAQELIKDRANKIDGNMKKDIHEKDLEYLENTYLNSKYVAKKYGWISINPLDENNKLKSREEISEDIWKKLNGRD